MHESEAVKLFDHLRVSGGAEIVNQVAGHNAIGRLGYPVAAPVVEDLDGGQPPTRCGTTWTRAEYKHVVRGLLFLKDISDAIKCHR